MIRASLICALLGAVPVLGQEPTSLPDAGLALAPSAEAVAAPAPAPSLLTELAWTPIIDAFGEFGARWPTDAAPSNAFSVPRVQVGVEASLRGVHARVLLEGVYGTAGGALLGVAGDSVVVRLREAWGGYRWRFLEAQLGLIPTLTVPEVERAFLFRELAPDALEGQRLIAPADFGGTVRASFPRGYGFAAVSVTNGEGYAQRELNGAKNVELTAVVHPLPRGSLAPLTALGTARFGSTGTATTRADRFGGAVLWQGPKLGLGFSAFAVNGYLDDGARRGVLLQGFARGELFGHLLLAARAHFFARDLTQADTVLELLGAVGVKVGPLDTFLAVQRTSLGGFARGALPGVEATELRLVLRVRWPSLDFPNTGDGT